MQLHSSVQIERYNGVVIDINATCLLLGSKCLQLPGMHAISGCDTVSYPFNKGKRQHNLLLCMRCWVKKMPLMETGRWFLTSMYGQPEGTSMGQASCNLYTRKKWKPLRIMALSPTEANLLFDIKRVHMQVMLWKAADRQGPLPFWTSPSSDRT